MDLEDSFELAGLGIGYLNLIEAAELACRCMLCEGYIEATEEVEVVSLHDEKLRKLLQPEIDKMVALLSKAVSEKTIKAIIIKRELNESLIAQETYIKDEELAKWFEERNTHLGDLYYDDYLHYTFKMYEAAHEAIESYKLSYKNKDFAKRESDSEYHGLHLKIYDLQRQLHEKSMTASPKQLHPKSRTSLLKMVFAMAVAKYRHDPTKSKNSSTSNIASHVRELGLNLDEDTIAKWLSEAANVLDGEYELKPK
jgi:hypothetical protein